jgi:hypothetical protein
MYQHYSVGLIIPCYNEEEGLPMVLNNLPSIIDKVYIVDNQSDDLTAQIAHHYGAIVLKEAKKGYGYAYKKGFQNIDTDIIVTMDGDGTYPPQEIPRLLSELVNENLDFISACRFPLQNPENMDWVSKIGNYILTFVTQLLFAYSIKDSQSGMWVFKKEVLSKIRLESNGMALSEEIKIEILKKKLRFKESHIPYYQRYGKKKIKKFQDGIKNLAFLFYLKFRK